MNKLHSDTYFRGYASYTSVPSMIYKGKTVVTAHMFKFPITHGVQIQFEIFMSEIVAGERM